MAVKLFAARNFIIGANVQVYRHSTDFIQINAPNVIDVIADVLHYFIDAVAIQEGEDVKLAFGSYAIKLPEQKAARLVEGGYIGKEVVLGIRPEDIKDEEIFVSGGADNVLDATVKVYEMLGAEVFLFFTIEGFDITVRVNPRTTARPGDTIKIALDPAKIHVFDKETERTITN